jgi:DNA replication protein DnaC
VCAQVSALAPRLAREESRRKNEKRKRQKRNLFFLCSPACSVFEWRIESVVSFANAAAMPMMLENARNLLQSAHDRGRLAHALILSGPAGSGKEELAAAMVTHLNGGGEDGADLCTLALF